MSAEANTDARQYSIGLLIMLVLLLAGTGYLGWSHGHLVTAGLMATIGICSLGGYRKGGIYFLFVIGGMILAVMFAPSSGGILEPHINSIFGIEGVLSRVLAIGVAGSAMVLVSVVIASVMSKSICEDRPILTILNQWLGVTLGICQGSCLAVILLGGLLAIEPVVSQNQGSREVQASPWRSKVAGAALEITAATRSDPIGKQIQRFNPMEQIPQLQSLTSSLSLARDPNALQQIVNRISVDEVRSSPAVQRAIADLESDPALRPFLTEGQPLDQKTMAGLMTNPAVLNLMDDPSVQEQLKLITEQLQATQ